MLSDRGVSNRVAPSRRGGVSPLTRKAPLTVTGPPAGSNGKLTGGPKTNQLPSASREAPEMPVTAVRAEPVQLGSSKSEPAVSGVRDGLLVYNPSLHPAKAPGLSPPASASAMPCITTRNSSSAATKPMRNLRAKGKGICDLRRPEISASQTRPRVQAQSRWRGALNGINESVVGISQGCQLSLKIPR